MLTKEKIDAVKKQLRSGIPEGEIKNQLQSEGYTEEEIHEMFAPSKIEMGSWYLLFGIVFTLAGFWVLIKGYGWLLLVGGIILLVCYQNEVRGNKEIK